MKTTNDTSNKKVQKKAALGRGLAGLLGGGLEDDGIPQSKAKVDLEEVVKPKLKESFVDDQKQETPPEPVVVKAPEAAENMRVWNLPIEKIVGNKEQPRKVFQREALEELAASISQKGILQPITVRKTDGNKYEIIAGERRWRAAQIAELQEVPALIKDVETQDALELALIENIQREDLNPVEEAKAYSFLMKEYSMTQAEVAEKVGKERATVANMLRLLNLHEEVLNSLSSGEISMGIAKVLLSLSNPKDQKRLARKVLKNNMTVKEVQKSVNKIKAVTTDSSAGLSDLQVTNRLMTGLSEELQKLLGTKVAIDYLKGKGKITVHFYSDDELNQFVERLRKQWNQQ